MDKRTVPPSPRRKKQLARLYEKLVRAAERVDAERFKSLLDSKKNL